MLVEFINRLFANPNLEKLNIFQKQAYLIDFLKKHPERMRHAMMTMELYSHLSGREALEILKAAIEAHSSRLLLEQFEKNAIARVDFSPFVEFNIKVDRSKTTEGIMSLYRDSISHPALQRALQAVLELFRFGVIDKYILASAAAKDPMYNTLFRIWRHGFDASNLKEFVKATALLLPFYYLPQQYDSVSNDKVNITELTSESLKTIFTREVENTLSKTLSGYPAEALSLASTSFLYANPDLAVKKPGGVFLGLLYAREYDTCAGTTANRGSDREYIARFLQSSHNHATMIEDMQRLAFQIEHG